MRKKSIWSGILALWLLALASCTGTDPGTTVKKPSAPLTSEGDSSFSEGKNSSGEVSLSPLPPSVDVTDFPSLTGSLPASEDTGSPTAALRRLPIRLRRFPLPRRNCVGRFLPSNITKRAIFPTVPWRKRVSMWRNRWQFCCAGFVFRRGVTP